MKARTSSSLKQRGFSLLTGFILAIIMFGTLAFFLSGQGINSGFGTAYSNTSKVSGLLTSAGYINTGFDAVTMGGTLPANVTFDAAISTGVFNPTSGGASQQSLDPTLFGRTTAIDGYWVYRKNDVTLPGVGVAVTADYTMMVSGLKLSICQQINNTLHGTALTAAPTTLTGFSDLLLVGAPTATVPTVAGVAADFVSAAIGISGWANGCYKTTDNNYVYIHTLLAQ